MSRTTKAQRDEWLKLWPEEDQFEHDLLADLDDAEKTIADLCAALEKAKFHPCDSGRPYVVSIAVEDLLDREYAIEAALQRARKVGT